MNNFKHYINEQRSLKMQTQGAYEILSQYKDDPDIYISFTHVDKIGLNPNSHDDYKTPLGIYTYPLKEIWKEFNHSEKLVVVPFKGSNTKYIWILKKNSCNFVEDLDKYSKSDLENDIKKLKVIYKNDNSDIDTLIDYAKTTAKIRKSNASQFWNITRTFADTEGGVTTVKWNKLFRKLGYCGFADKSGIGIIHPNEPTQAIFLTTRAFKTVRKIRNIDVTNITLTSDTQLILFLNVNSQIVRDIYQRGKQLYIGHKRNNLSIYYELGGNLKNVSYFKKPSTVKNMFLRAVKRWNFRYFFGDVLYDILGKSLIKMSYDTNLTKALLFNVVNFVDGRKKPTYIIEYLKKHSEKVLSDSLLTDSMIKSASSLIEYDPNLNKNPHSQFYVIDDSIAEIKKRKNVLLTRLWDSWTFDEMLASVRKLKNTIYHLKKNGEYNDWKNEIFNVAKQEGLLGKKMK